MLVKVLPIRGTNMHVWDRKKYFPGEIKDLDDELAEMLIKKRIVEKLPDPPRRGPGRPRKVFGG